jgi:hypothetical protein
LEDEMNDELQKALAAFLQTMLASVEQGAAFAQEQAPLVVQEFLRWGLMSNALGAAVFAVGAFVCIRLTRGFWEEDSDSTVAIFSCIGAVAGVCLSVVCAFDALKVWVAPRVYVLDWLRGFVK